jgi:diadenosine tetraphosphate (Ap4A) HIT family hydrolase
MLNSQQVEQIKKQLISQIKKNFPEEKKKETISQINLLNPSELEEFLKKNNLIKNSEESSNCVFCSIYSGKIPNKKVGENPDAIAVLEINPISKGHTIIIPKEHSITKEELIKKTENLYKEISKKIKKHLKPKEIIISSSNLFGHEIINIIPVYKKENLESERYKAEEKELNFIQETLLKKEKKKPLKKTKPEKIQKKEILWLPKRIP